MPDKPFGLSIKVLIRDGDGRCLLLKRSMASKGNPGKWDLPGGKLDPGETFEQGLRREVAEEAGLTISLTRVLGAAESATADRRVAYLIFEGQLASGTVQLSSEHDDFRWVKIKDLGKMDMAPQFIPLLQSVSRENA